jgi:hypothetical protein
MSKFFRVERFPVSGLVRVYIGSLFKDMTEDDLAEFSACLFSALCDRQQEREAPESKFTIAEKYDGTLSYGIGRAKVSHRLFASKLATLRTYLLSVSHFCATRRPLSLNSRQQASSSQSRPSAIRCRCMPVAGRIRAIPSPQSRQPCSRLRQSQRSLCALDATLRIITMREHRMSLTSHRAGAEMKPTIIGFEQRYSDDSGVEFAVRLDSGTIEFEHINDVDFPLCELDWLIECLMNIRALTTGQKQEEAK